MMLNLFTQFAAGCDLDASQFGIPTWYKYLQGETDPSGVCRVMTKFSLTKLNALLSIGLAIVEIMLFIAGIVAVAYIIYGGFQYLLSQGNPEQTTVAKNTVLNAVIGLVIAVLASTLVRFLATRLSA